MNTNEGFVKLPRSILSWRWYTEPNILRLYIHLLLKASFRDTEWKTENIKKGQLITGRKKLAEELRMSESMITRTLKKLESTGEISLNSNNKYTVITLLKWAEYQESSYFFCQHPNNNRTTNEQQTNNNRTHLNNVNKENNKKNVKKYSTPAWKRENPQMSTIDHSLMDLIING